MRRLSIQSLPLWAVVAARFFRRWLERRAEVPRHELVVAVAERLALGLAARCRLDDEFEEFPAHAGDGLLTRSDDTTIDVHVLFHLVVHGRVGGDLDRRRRPAAEAGAAA